MNSGLFETLFLNDIPLMDVRAPVEFQQGSFPGAENRPLLDDQQRQLVGTEYKLKGQDKAIELGWQLATDEVQQQRLDYWQSFIQQHPQGYLYCFRGGLRSQLSQQLLQQAGIDYPIVPGGYKAMRRYLIDQLDHAAAHSPVVIVAGPTGSGKTKAIHQISRALDLEGRAQHRGSAFGSLAKQQPSQIDFENQLSIDWLKLRQQNASKAVFIEDEGRLIGRLNVPLTLQAAMKSAPIAVIEEPLQQRVQWVLEDYVLNSLQGQQQNPKAVLSFSENLSHKLYRIRKRLGGERYQLLLTLFQQAAAEFLAEGRLDKFRQGIELLLRDYYDPMYQYQLEQRQGKIVFRGNCADTIAWCQNQSD